MTDSEREKLQCVEWAERHGLGSFCQGDQWQMFSDAYSLGHADALDGGAVSQDAEIERLQRQVSALTDQRDNAMRSLDTQALANKETVRLLTAEIARLNEDLRDAHREYRYLQEVRK